jgi:hypothetical protein
MKESVKTSWHSQRHVLFGLATIIAGTRVLVGADPGYLRVSATSDLQCSDGNSVCCGRHHHVRNLDQASMRLPRSSFSIPRPGDDRYLYAVGSAVAIQSVRAMTFRTFVWLILFLGLAWMSHRDKISGVKRDDQPIIPPNDAR